MISVVLGMAAADFITGVIKACIQCDLSSKVMRKGGLNKLSEVIIMSVVCGLEYGIGLLKQIGELSAPVDITGVVTSGLVFAYITIMELISILENYSDISPNAEWIRGLIQKLRRFSEKKEEEQHEKRH